MHNLLSAGPVIFNYNQDSNIILEQGIVHTRDALNFCYNNLLFNATDFAINNDNLLIITDNTKLANNIKPLTAVSTEQFLTSGCVYLTTNEGQYLYANTPYATGGSTISLTNSILSATIFNVIFDALSGYNTVRFYYNVPNYDPIYLKGNGALPASVGEPLSAATVLSAGLFREAGDALRITFNYLLSGDSLLLIDHNSKKAITYYNSTGFAFTPLTEYIAANSLSGANNFIFKIKRVEDSNNANQIETRGQSDLVKYNRDDNLITIDEASGNVNFNYLLTAPYKSLSGTYLDINTALLKNYYSSEFIQNPNLDTQLRSYNRIFTGLNEEKGYENIYLGYNTSVINKTFSKDSDTYFHFPYNSAQYVLTNTISAIGNITQIYPYTYEINSLSVSARLISLEGSSTGAQISFKSGQNNVNLGIIGLGISALDPSTNVNPYTAVNYGWRIQNDSTAGITESGVSLISAIPGFDYSPTRRYTTDTIFTIIYQNNTISYYFDNILIRTVTGVTGKLYFIGALDVCNYPGSVITNINYAQLPETNLIVPLSSSTLISYGAYAGPSPSRADRIFKKNANYGQYTNWGNSSSPQKGVYVCSWLSAGANKDITPIWMDRYYDPAYLNLYTNVARLTAAVYSLSGLLIESSNNYPNIIWDTPTTLTFEPGVLYYYHRIGENDNFNTVNQLSGLQYHITDWAPDIINNVTGLTAGTITNFTSTTSGTNDQINANWFNCDQSSYGSITTNDDNFANNRGTTLAFYAYEDDWNTVYGEQIVGNYFNGGIGIFNNIEESTPFFTIRTQNKIKTLNYNLVEINSEDYTTFNNTNSAFNYILKGLYDEEYYVIDSNPNGYFISIVDPDDLIIKKSVLSAFASDITSYSITNTTLTLEESSQVKYAILQSRISSTECVYYKYTTTGILSISAGIPGYNNFAVNNDGDLIYYNSPYQTRGGIAVLSGCNNTVDSNNFIFALSGDYILRGKTAEELSGYNTTTGTPSAAIINVYKAEYINCDQEDSIWVLYNYNSLAKLKNDGTVVWNKQITAGETVIQAGGYRNIGFLAENTTTGINYYGIVIDAIRQYIYKVDTNGNVIAKLYVPGLIAGGDNTGFDYQKKYVEPVTSPGIKLKLVYKDSTTQPPVPRYTTLTATTSALTPGWHHFAVTFAENAETRLYIDGVVVNSAAAQNIVLQRIYNYKNNPEILIGASSFKISNLNNWVENSTFNLFNGKIADLRFYSTALNEYNIKALANNLLYNRFTDLNWSAPTGQRAYIEKIDHFFLQRMPGSKSQYFNVRIKNSQITDPIVRGIIENNLVTAINNVAPAYTKLRSIIWE